MALTDPELDLLRELLEDDPTDEAFLQVGEELVRRGQWAEAEAILSGGMGVSGARSAHPGERKGWSLLARAALECAHYDVALVALSKIETDPARDPQNAQLKILALERAGHLADAASCIAAYLAVDPDDVVVTAARERLSAPPPETTRRASDPFLTVERAERYVAVGRSDRAVRVYRRILFHNPGDHGLLARLRQLSVDERDWRTDDLSEELTDPGATPPDLQLPSGLPVPPGLHMPQPQLVAAVADEEQTEPREMPDAVRDYVANTSSEWCKPSKPSRGVITADRVTADMVTPDHVHPDSPTDPDDQDTDLHPLRADGTIARVARKGGKRRRSLIDR